MNNFQQTVDLKDKLKPKPEAPPRSASRPPAKAEEEPPVRPAKKKRLSRASAIDQVYAEPDESAKRARFQQIERARPSAAGVGFYKLVASLLGLALIGVVFYFNFFASPRDSGQSALNQGPFESRWYAVKLVNGETYYGQIADTTADPVIIARVYYDYDQLNQADSQPKTESGSLRLVKRGRETHGPEGEMSVVRSQVLFMETLKEDSPVLKAIVDNEK